MKKEIIEKIKSKNIICSHPWRTIDIDQDGTIRFCPYNIGIDNVGNLLKNNYYNIWNGNLANKIRDDILENKYSYCNLENCYGIEKIFFCDKNNFDFSTKIKRVNFNIDTSCNVACVFCRKQHNNNLNNNDDFPNQLLQEFNSNLEKNIDLIDELYMPLLKDIEYIAANGSGEIFISKFYKKLLKKVSAKYPNIKYMIMTNGLLCNEKTLKELNIEDKLKYVIVSLHAITEETYNKMVKGSNFKKVINNIKYLSQLKKDDKMDCFALTFVITSLNYKELPQFIEFAYSVDAIPQFWCVREDEGYLDPDSLRKYNVANPEHPDHQDFLKVLTNPVFEKYQLKTNHLIVSMNNKIEDNII